MSDNGEDNSAAASAAGAPLFRARTYVLLGLVAVLAAELVTYGLWAEKATVRAALSCLPEAGGREFICPLTAGLSPKQEGRLRHALKARFGLVCRDRDSIPSERWVWTKTEPAKLIGFEGGCLWSFVVLKRGWLWLKVESDYWQSVKESGAERADYVWLFGTWVRVSTSRAEAPQKHAAGADKEP